MRRTIATDVALAFTMWRRRPPRILRILAEPTRLRLAQREDDIESGDGIHNGPLGKPRAAKGKNPQIAHKFQLF